MSGRISPTTQIGSALGLGSCILLFVIGWGHPALLKAWERQTGWSGWTKQRTAPLPYPLPSAGLEFPGGGWTTKCLGWLSLCRSVFACVLGRFCLLPLACGPQSLAAPQGKSLQMMSGFWGFHLLCGIYLLYSPQPWLWGSHCGVCVCCVLTPQRLRE